MQFVNIFLRFLWIRRVNSGCNSYCLTSLLRGTLLLCVTLTIVTSFYSSFMLASMHLKKISSNDSFYHYSTNKSAIGPSVSTGKESQKNNDSGANVRAFLRRLRKSGRMLELVKSVQGVADNVSISEYYPEHLSLNGHRFWSLDGTEINTIVICTAMRQSSSNERPIPNWIHFYRFFSNGKRNITLQFVDYLALLSAVWLSEAEKVVLWSSGAPSGRYWQQLVLNLTVHGRRNRLLLATRPLPSQVFDRPVRVIQHQVDVMKLETAIMLGGIFLDSDVVTLRSLQPLRSHDCAIGRESASGLTIGAFMSKPQSSFLLLWYTLYQTFTDSQWATHSVMLPHQMWLKYPHLCHVEPEYIARPGWSEAELRQMYGNLSALQVKWNWHNNYLLHLWQHSRPEINETSVGRLNSMFGQVVRFIIYGTQDFV